MDLRSMLEAHYTGYDEDGRLLTRFGQVEYITEKIPHRFFQSYP